MIATRMILLLLVAWAEPGDSPELLPKTPPDWRFERIDFPLPFAPELKYKGFEELSFAPGMFNAQSDTYFTYIFVMHLTNEISINAEFLQSLLVTYFRGLCRTVAQGTDFDIDVSKVSATVREVHREAERTRQFVVRLDSFDPFVTGKPLKLHLEMLVVEGSRNDHRIFAAVSPKPVDSPVWKILQKLKREFQMNATKSRK